MLDGSTVGATTGSSVGMVEKVGRSVDDGCEVGNDEIVLE